MNNTKNNHFVPQGYLKNFLNDNLSLYKYDLNNSLKSYEVTNLKKECSCKNLYSTKQKITYEGQKEEENFKINQDKSFVKISSKKRSSSRRKVNQHIKNLKNIKGEEDD